MRQYQTISIWPITSEMAAGCLDIKDGHVHSFWLDGIISGCDLEVERVYKMMESAENDNRLYYLPHAFAVHAVASWDTKYKKWTYLECFMDGLEKLKELLSQQCVMEINLAVGNKYMDTDQSKSHSAGSQKSAAEALDEMLTYPDVFGCDGADVEALCRDMDKETKIIIEICSLTDTGVETDQGNIKLLDFVTGLRSRRFIPVSADTKPER